MEKYKYCNIEPASSPRVGGREGERKKTGGTGGWGFGCTGGGGDAREGDVFLHISFLSCGLRGCCVRKNRERNARIRVYVYNNHIFHI